LKLLLLAFRSDLLGASISLVAPFSINMNQYTCGNSSKLMLIKQFLGNCFTA